MKISNTQIIIIVVCVIIAAAILIYFLTKPIQPTTDETENGLTVHVKKLFIDEPLKKTLGMSNGYKANKEYIFNAIDAAFKQDALNFCKCMVDFLKKYSGKNESDILLFNQEDFANAIMTAFFIAQQDGVSLPFCQANIRQLDYMIKFLGGTCYPDINDLITFIKTNINNSYRIDEINNMGAPEIKLSDKELNAQQSFLSSNGCTNSQI